MDKRSVNGEAESITSNVELSYVTPAQFLHEKPLLGMPTHPE